MEHAKNGTSQEEERKDYKRAASRYYTLEDHPFIEVDENSDSDDSSLFKDDESESEYLRKKYGH